MREGDKEFCSENLNTLTKLHSANIVAVQLLSGGILLTGSVDRTLKKFIIEGLPDVAGVRPSVAHLQ